MSEIRIDLSGSDAESLKQLAKGDPLSLESIKGTVTSNDGKTLVASVDEVECCDDDEGESMEPTEGEPEGDSKSGHTPIAVIALKTK